MGTLILAGCASVDIKQSIARANQDAVNLTDGRLTLVQTDRERGELQSAATAILSKPLSADDAVRLALINSPAMQAMLAQSWADAASAAQFGRLPNPVLTLERLRLPLETDIGRMLAFGLLDVLTLPQRNRSANARLEQVQLQLTNDVVEKVTQVRQVWVAALAAKQSLTYAQQVSDSAEASAELARRMLAVGNFNKLQRARQQAFYADAAAQLANASHAATASREALVRVLGLTDAQALQMQLPDRLPDIPASARTAEDVSSAASRGRLDIKMAQAAMNATAVAQGLSAITSFTDIELSVIRNTSIERADGHRTNARGFEVAVKLPIFDWGGLQRDAMSAQMLVAASRLDATVRAAGSNLREAYSAYRTTYDIAKHYRDEIVPLRKLIADENVLRYNGMIIGVFELLADSRDQISSVIAAINAQQQFWMADAALQSSIMGKPMMMQSMGAAPAAGGGGDAPH
ncbi:MAG: TolC family protein [Casimicrobium sp.]|jgi:outer membrane protein TolC